VGRIKVLCGFLFSISGQEFGPEEFNMCSVRAVCCNDVNVSPHFVFIVYN
jgi:hypothetical protein